MVVIKTNKKYLTYYMENKYKLPESIKNILNKDSS